MGRSRVDRGYKWEGVMRELGENEGWERKGRRMEGER